MQSGVKFFKLWFPWLDIIALVLSILVVLLPAMNPFDKYNLLKDGKPVTAEITAEVHTLTSFYFDYSFKTTTGDLVENWQKTLAPNELKINRNHKPTTAQVIYLPSDPSVNWINWDHHYDVKTYWKDYIIDTSIAIFIFYLVLMLMFRFGYWQERNKKYNGGQLL